MSADLKISEGSLTRLKANLARLKFALEEPVDGETAAGATGNRPLIAAVQEFAKVWDAKRVTTLTSVEALQLMMAAMIEDFAAADSQLAGMVAEGSGQ